MRHVTLEIGRFMADWRTLNVVFLESFRHDGNRWPRHGWTIRVSRGDTGGHRGIPAFRNGPCRIASGGRGGSSHGNRAGGGVMRWRYTTGAFARPPPPRVPPAMFRHHHRPINLPSRRRRRRCPRRRRRAHARKMRRGTSSPFRTHIPITPSQRGFEPRSPPPASATSPPPSLSPAFRSCRNTN